MLSVPTPLQNLSNLFAAKQEDSSFNRAISPEYFKNWPNHKTPVTRNEIIDISKEAGNDLETKSKTRKNIIGRDLNNLVSIYRSIVGFVQKKLEAKMASASFSNLSEFKQQYKLYSDLVNGAVNTVLKPLINSANSVKDKVENIFETERKNLLSEIKGSIKAIDDQASANNAKKSLASLGAELHKIHQHVFKTDLSTDYKTEIEEQFMP